MRPELTRRGMLFAAGLIALALCAGCGEVHARLTVGAARPVTVAVDGPPAGFSPALYAPLYAAQADGEFRDGALSVKIVTASGGSLAALESNRATVAIATEPEVLAARSDGEQVVSIAALLDAPLEGIVSLARRTIASADRLAGHTVATDGTALSAADLATALAGAHVAATKVHELDAGANLGGALRSRRAIATIGPWPLEKVELDLARHPAVVLALTRTGVPSYSGMVVVVRINEAHYQGPLLRAFLQSLIRGAARVAVAPAATAATLATQDAKTAPRINQALLAQLAPLAASATAGNPFGFQNPDAWVTFADWMHAHGLLAHTANPGLAITNEFLPGQGEQIVTGS
jgi:putative hydroxymethylpyrimidine transport system substrate-binding protein